MIPKVIHYCWFGHNPLPPLAVECITSWKKYLPDYEIKEWNEDNFDVNIIQYTSEAYKIGKYAFVSDYARFWILYHHERIDGHGYYSCPGDKIPLPARIISIADTYSAITMRRSYKAPKTHEDALQIIKEVAGTQLDAELVKYFLTIPKERLIQCIPEQVKY